MVWLYFLVLDTKKQLNELIDHKFSTIDVKNEGKVFLKDYIEVGKTDPETIEIFDYLNGGIADTIASNAIKNENKEILKELNNIQSKISAIVNFFQGNTKRKLSEQNQLIPPINSSCYQKGFKTINFNSPQKDEIDKL